VQSSYFPENVRALSDSGREIVAIVPRPDLIAARNDELPLIGVAPFSLLIVMRRAIAKHPKVWFVIKVRLAINAAINAFNSPLGFVGQTKAVLIEKGNESPFS
jgi:hypothetical protein